MTAASDDGNRGYHLLRLPFRLFVLRLTALRFFFPFPPPRLKGVLWSASLGSPTCSLRTFLALFLKARRFFCTGLPWYERYSSL